MVGLDIGSKTIKIVELQKEGDAFSLVASGIVGYSGTTVARMEDEKEIAGVAQIIKKLHNEKATPPEVLVLLVAAPRVLVEKFTKVVSLAGLTPIAVETELMATARSLAASDRTVLLVDFGAASTNIAVCQNGLL